MSQVCEMNKENLETSNPKAETAIQEGSSPLSKRQLNSSEKLEIEAKKTGEPTSSIEAKPAQLPSLADNTKDTKDSMVLEDSAKDLKEDAEFAPEKEEADDSSIEDDGEESSSHSSVDLEEYIKNRESITENPSTPEDPEEEEPEEDEE